MNTKLIYTGYRTTTRYHSIIEVEYNCPRCLSVSNIIRLECPGTLVSPVKFVKVDLRGIVGQPTINFCRASTIQNSKSPRCFNRFKYTRYTKGCGTG